MQVSIIPESAPFNAEQRAWLNGFLAGWLGLQDSAGAPVQPAPILPTPPAPTVEDLPWHDSALPISERLKLAEGRPLADRLMAAMAQLDCGACGYLCRTYSEAIASGSESKLNLCSPGGSETSKALKQIRNTTKPGTNGAVANGKPTSPAIVTNTWSRLHPFAATILRSVRLNGPGSEKETRHVEIDLDDLGPTFRVGDSLGVIPTNCGELVDELIAALGASGDERVANASGDEMPLRVALARDCCLSEINEDILVLLADAATVADEAATLRRLVEDDTPLAGLDVLDVLRRFPSARPAPRDLLRSLSELRPRLYSISSSPKRHPGQVHLTVARVAYDAHGRSRKGVASTMLADRVETGSQVRVFVQPSHGFTLPVDPDAPIVMIGPGTGIAPFRAFLHERDAIGARGKNWLFFGDQRGDCDFLYEDELNDLAARGVLTRLDTAFSRDQDRKVYVQHRMLEQGSELFAWLEAGAHVFVCGDARRMAVDVDRALREVVRVHGARDDDAAAAYVRDLASAGRYLRDVY
jgi:sulfite reductase (NADPH) flavoprotein alpha-component